MPLGQRLRSVPAVLALARLDQEDPAVDGRSFGAWLDAHGQRGLSLPALWELLTVATLNAPPRDASLALAAKVVRTGLLETAGGADIGYSRVPLGELHGVAGRARARIARRAGAHRKPGARAAADLAGLERRRPMTVRSPRGPSSSPCPMTPSPTSRRRMRASTRPGCGRSAAAPSSTCTSSTTGSSWPNRSLRRSTPPCSGSSIALPRPGCSAASTWPSRCPPPQEWQERKAAEIEKIFVAELARLLPRADPGHVERVLVTREPHATFAQLPGQLAHRPANETALPGLVVAGAWTRTGWPATMESAVRSGQAAARALSAA